MSLDPKRAALARVLDARGVSQDGLLDELLDALGDGPASAAAASQTPPGTTHAAEVGGHLLTWNTDDGTFQFAGVPAVLMWVDSTLAGLWAGMCDMVGPERFRLALQNQGRNSVEGDWAVISQGESFEEGFTLLAGVAAAAGWGRWELRGLDEDRQELCIHTRGSWEALLASALGPDWGVHFLAGKFAGYGTRLFGHNCWSEVERGDGDDPTALCFRVHRSSRSLESELDALLASDAATRADLAVAVQRLRREVEERVRIAEELLESKHLAEAATRAKSSFLANMSHELRTPLHGILGSLELLADSELDGMQAELSGTALESARSLLSIVGDVLDLSKVEAGELDLVETELELGRLVQGAADLLMPTAERRGLALHVELDPELLLSRRGDGGRVRQVLLNLVSNALKFTPAGSVTVRALAGADERVRFEVADTGIGISSDRVRAVFEPFRQVDDSMGRQYAGTGLGLAICAALVDRMSGELGVHSVEGEGSTFWFELPLPVRARPAQLPPPQEWLPERLSGTVLVVDDVDINRTIASHMVRSIGCDVRLASSALEALEQMATGRFDLVLMDLMMPGMDGLQAVRHYRATEPADQRLPVVAMTANAMLGDEEECLAAGMSAYLPKPVRLDALRRCLARWLVPAGAPAALG